MSLERFIRRPIIGSIVCTPQVAAIGESVCIEVHDADGKAYDNTESFNITINGVPGSKQYVVWNRPGTKSITVVAGSRNAVQTVKASVQINPLANGEQPILLSTQAVHHSPGTLRFSLLNAPERKLQGKPRSLLANPVLVQNTPRVSSTPTTVMTPTLGRSVVQNVRVQTISAVTASAHSAVRPGGVARPLANVGGSVTQAAYKWELASNVLGTSHPTMEYDFSAHLNPNRAHTVFHVKLTVQLPGEAARVIQRSVSVANPYFLSRRRGVLQPPIVTSDLSAVFSDGNYRASFTVRNPENFDLVLSSSQLELTFEDGPREFEMRPSIASQTILKANAVTRINVVIPQAQLSKQAIAFCVHYKGVAPNGMKVRVSPHFDVPQHIKKKVLVDAAFQNLLSDLARNNLVANSSSISTVEVNQLTRNGMISVDHAMNIVSANTRMSGISSGAVAALQNIKPTSPVITLKDHKVPLFAVEGEECLPWNMPDNIPDGMFCMPTAETRWMQMPARFMNAKKGDLILNPGNGSLISAVLQTVTPPQRFSHSGIMTRNFDEITHSTASEGRLVSFIDSDGARPDVLKYLWPGVITQTIESAVDGEDKVDPETGTKYSISGFSTFESKMDLGGVTPEIVPAMVVKPDPTLETLEIRQTLHGIADFAWQQTEKSHYRFFCYTDPSIGLSDKAPASSKWAAGTFPTVCSSLLWMSIKQSGVPMEGGSLEQSDLAEGAQIVPSTPDGLYLYQSDERIAAGEVLYSKIHEMVLESAGWLGNLLTDAADNTANQLLNAFASDWCETEAKDSDKWRQTGDANAVSPANLEFFDAPLYGFVEPLIYRPARWEEVTIYKWKKVLQTGTLHGVVKLDGNPHAGASVQISENQFTHSAADGSFTLTNVPVGQIIVEASHQELKGKATVNVTANATTQVTVNLEQPSHLFRRMVIDGWMATTDYEFAAAAYPHAVGDIYNIAQLGPSSSTHVTKTFDLTADDAMGRLYLTFDLLANDAIQVKAKLRCYDSGTDDTDDFDDGNLDPFVIQAGHSGTWWMFVDGDNYTEAHFTLTNKVDPS